MTKGFCGAGFGRLVRNPMARDAVVTGAHYIQRGLEAFGGVRFGATLPSVRELIEILAYSGGGVSAVFWPAGRAALPGNESRPCPCCLEGIDNSRLFPGRKKFGVRIVRCLKCGAEVSILGFGHFRPFKERTSPAGPAAAPCKLSKALSAITDGLLHPSLSGRDILVSAALLARDLMVLCPRNPSEGKEGGPRRMLIMSDSILNSLFGVNDATEDTARVWACAGIDPPPFEADFHFCPAAGPFPPGKWEMVLAADCIDGMARPLANGGARPLEILDSLDSLLRPGGIFAALVPDRGSRPSTEQGRRWPFAVSRKRLISFDFRALETVLAKRGLRVFDFSAETRTGAGRPGFMVLASRRPSEVDLRPLLKSTPASGPVLIPGHGFASDSDSKAGSGYSEISCASLEPAAEFKKMGFPRILFRIPRAAIGDLLLATPIFRACRQAFPLARISVSTPGPLPALCGNSDLDGVAACISGETFDATVTLAYDLTPELSIVDSYARCAGLQVSDRRPILPPLPHVGEIAALSQIPCDSPLAVMHTMTGDRIKRWGAEKYQKVADYLVSKGWSVAAVGSSVDCVPIDGALNLIGRADILSTMSVIASAKFFFGLDSFPMHAACAVRVPSVVLFGSTEARKVVSDGSVLLPVETLEPCGGCRMRCLPTRFASNVACRRDTLRCMDGISASRAIEAVASVLDGSAVFMGIPGSVRNGGPGSRFSEGGPWI